MIDTENVIDFDGWFSAAVDALDQLRKLPVPTERDGIAGLVAWHDEFKKILSLVPEFPDTSALTTFAEDVYRELDRMSDTMTASQTGEFEKPHPRDDGLLSQPDTICFPAYITGGSQSAGWTWTEQEGTAGGGWSALSGGRNSTDDGKAYLTRDIVEIANNTLVYIRSVTLTTGATEWRFEPPIPKPVTQYHGIYVNSDSRYDADVLRST